MSTDGVRLDEGFWLPFGRALAFPSQSSQHCACGHAAHSSEPGIGCTTYACLLSEPWNTLPSP